MECQLEVTATIKTASSVSSAEVCYWSSFTCIRINHIVNSVTRRPPAPPVFFVGTLWMEMVSRLAVINLEMPRFIIHTVSGKDVDPLRKITSQNHNNRDQSFKCSVGMLKSAVHCAAIVL